MFNIEIKYFFLPRRNQITVLKQVHWEMKFDEDFFLYGFIKQFVFSVEIM